MKKHLLTPGSPREQRLDAWWLWRGIYFPIYFLDLSCATIPLCFLLNYIYKFHGKVVNQCWTFITIVNSILTPVLDGNFPHRKKKRSRNIHRGKSSREKKIKKHKNCYQKTLPEVSAIEAWALRCMLLHYMPLCQVCESGGTNGHAEYEMICRRSGNGNLTQSEVSLSIQFK